MPDKFSTNFTDMFESLVPVPVQQALVQYDVRKQEIVNTEIGKLRESTMLLNSILSSLNLPAAIEDTSGGQLPPSLKEKATTVCEKVEKYSHTFFKEINELLKLNFIKF